MVHASMLQDGKFHRIIQSSESELQLTMPSKYTAPGEKVHIQLKCSFSKQELRTQEQNIALRNKLTYQRRIFSRTPKHKNQVARTQEQKIILNNKLTCQTRSLNRIPRSQNTRTEQ